MSVVNETNFIFLTVAKISGWCKYKKPPLSLLPSSCLRLFLLLTMETSPRFKNSLALGKQLDTLLLQFLTVNDHDDGGRTDLRNVTAAERKLSGKERHSIGLAAPGCAEVGAAFSCLLHD